MIHLDVGGTTAIRLATGKDPTISLSATGGGGTVPPYSGPYTATPSNSVQVFAVDGKKMMQDFTVNPIPSNYGLITWNGSTLTVS